MRVPINNRKIRNKTAPLTTKTTTRKRTLLTKAELCKTKTKSIVNKNANKNIKNEAVKPKTKKIQKSSQKDPVTTPATSTSTSPKDSKKVAKLKTSTTTTNKQIKPNKNTVDKIKKETVKKQPQKIQSQTKIKKKVQKSAKNVGASSASTNLEEDNEKAQTIEKLLKEVTANLSKSDKNVSLTDSKKEKKKSIQVKKVKDKEPVKKIKQEILDDKKDVPSRNELKKPFKKRDFEQLDQKFKLLDTSSIKKEHVETDEVPPPSVEPIDVYEFKVDKKEVKLIPKQEPIDSESDKSSLNSVKKRKRSKLVVLKKQKLKTLKKQQQSSDSDHPTISKRRKLLRFWNGPKRHRVASLNALAKVHCLYENESRGAFLELLKPRRTRNATAAAAASESEEQPPSPPVQRNLRTAPGLRGAGKHWDMHSAITSSSEESSPDSSGGGNSKKLDPPPSYKQKQLMKNKVGKPKLNETTTKQVSTSTTENKRRNRTEIVMDLKDMVVRKRMASLNASAILAASYSPEKRSNKDSSSSEDDMDTTDDDDSVVSARTRRSAALAAASNDSERDRKLISNKKKVSVIVNQDTDVTITGVYVNSTTRSTHLHEGYCSIAGMQYRISATSHTQTNATAVSTETLQLHSTTQDQGSTDNISGDAQQTQSGSTTGTQPQSVGKSYTPLNALSNMQPPGAPSSQCGVNAERNNSGHANVNTVGGLIPPQSQSVTNNSGISTNSTVGNGGIHHQQASQLSPISATVGRVIPRQHGCSSSAFSAPPYVGPHHHHHHHHLHHIPKMEHPTPHPPPAHPPVHGYIHGYYQPAGPLISTHLPHSHVVPPPQTGPPLLGPLSSGKISAPLPSLETTPSSPLSQQPPAPSSAGESSDNDVIITATSTNSSNGGGTSAADTPHNTTGPTAQAPPPTAAAFRYASYSAPAGPLPPGYSTAGYGFPPAQYYTTAQYGPGAPPHHQPHHFHHQDLCYSTTGPPPYPPYFHSKAYGSLPAGGYRRFVSSSGPPPPSQYYQQEVFPTAAQGGQQSSQVVTAVSTTGSGPVRTSYQQGTPSSSVNLDTGGPPLVETYQPPPAGAVSIVEPYPGPPSHYFSGYSPSIGPPPGCYSQPPTRNLAFIDASYQSCPCPMQSCPKNGHTGPLTGDGKRSNMTVIAKETTTAGMMPLPPVALALPQEPASVIGPPSPARGSAGMPPPPSPAGATYQPISTPKQEDTNNNNTAVRCNSADSKSIDKVRRKARVGKNMVRNTIASNFTTYRQTEMLLMCHSSESMVKRETISPDNNEVIVEKQTVLEDDKIEEKCDTNECIIETITFGGSKRLEDDQCSEHSPDTTTIEEEPFNKSENEVKEQNIRLQSDTINTAQITSSGSDEPVVESTVTNIENDASEENIEKIENATTPAAGTKRKLQQFDSINENLVQKKQKSSYKDLINKNPTVIQINNGKRKLNCAVTTSAPTKPIKPKRTAANIVDSNNKSTKSGVKRRKSESSTDSIKKLKTSKEDCNETILDAADSTTTVMTASLKKPSNKLTKKLPLMECLNSKEAVIDDSNNNNEAKFNETQDKLVNRTRKKSKIINHNTSSSKATRSKVIATSNKRNTKQHTVEDVPMPVLKVPRRASSLTPRWSNGWSWEGEPYRAKVFLNSDDVVVTRTCYPAMRHIEGDIIYPRDCVLLKSGQRKNDLPFVAKVAALWENPEDGEMMMSLFWFYRPEHTEQGRLPTDHTDEVFASRHKDTNSVACIEDKCYVLTFFEYCRHYKNVRLLEEDLGDETAENIVPMPDGGSYPRNSRQPPRNHATPSDLVFFCSRVYDFRQKRVVKNPN